MTPVAWIRYCSDGTYEGPIADCDARMDDARRNSGAWTPLYEQPQPAPSNVVQIDINDDAQTRKAERERCAKVCDVEFWVATKRDGAAAGVAAGNCAAAIRAIKD